MGLLQKVSAGEIAPEKEEQSAPETKVIREKSNSVGLLKKSLIVSQNDKLDFFEFLNKYQFSLCGVLRLEQGAYCVYKSFGLDGKSICLFDSTQDFWDGTLTDKNNLYSFKAGSTEILPFYQFFSQDIKNHLEMLYFYKLEDNSILFFTSSNDYTIPQSLIFDIQNIDFDSETKTDIQSIDMDNNSYFLYSIDLTEALESFVITDHVQSDIKIVKAISNELYFNFIKYFARPSAVSMSEIGKYKLAYCSPEVVPEELLYNHLRYQIKKKIDNHSELISIDFYKNAQSISEIKTFLQAE